MIEQPILVRKGFKVAVVLFAATLMGGYVVYSHYNSKRPIRGTKATSILEEMRLIDGAKDQYVLENRLDGSPTQNPFVEPRLFENLINVASENPPGSPTQNASITSSVESISAPVTLTLAPNSQPLQTPPSGVIFSTKSAPVFRSPPAQQTQPAADLPALEKQPASQKPRAVAPGSKSAGVFKPEPKGSK